MNKNFSLLLAILGSIVITIIMGYGAWQGYQAYTLGESQLFPNTLFASVTFGAFIALMRVFLVCFALGLAIYFISIPFQFWAIWFPQSEDKRHNAAWSVRTLSGLAKPELRATDRPNTFRKKNL